MSPVAPSLVAYRAYMEWQHRIEAAFLVMHTNPAPFILYLDDEEVRRLWQDIEHPIDSLASAVREYMDWSSPATMFHKISAGVDQWVRGRRVSPPPVLPLLAVSVLAASRMHRDAMASTAAYFPRLDELLFPGRAVEHRRLAADRLSRSFNVVPSMWRLLSSWIDERSEIYGVSTIRNHPHLHRIGFSLSQAVIRKSDRLNLTRFFSSIDVKGRGVPERAILLAYLRQWSARSRGMSEQFCNALDDENLSGLLIGHVCRLAETWDGLILTAEGKRLLSPRIAVDLDLREAEWLIPLVDGLESEVLKGQGHEVAISWPDHGAFYEVSGSLPPVAAVIYAGAKLHGERATASFGGSDIVILRQDSAAAGWLSVASLEAHEKHLLIVRPDLQQELEEMLAQAADPGWRLMRQSFAQALVPGSLVYTGVRFSNESSYVTAVAALTPAMVRSLTEAAPRPRLHGGLPLGRGITRNAYLHGGAPSLVLPAGAEPRSVEVELDGVRQDPPLRATGFPVPLQGLEPGKHVIVADGERLEFELLQGLDGGRRGARGSLGWSINDGHVQLQNDPPGSDAVRGAAVPGGVVEPLLLRRGSSAWFIQRSGQVRQVHEPAPMTWPSYASMPAPYYFEVVPGPDDVWLLERRRAGFRAPVLLSWQDPSFIDVDGPSVRLWSELVTLTAGTSPAWDIYLRIFRRWNERHSSRGVPALDR